MADAAVSLDEFRILATLALRANASVLHVSHRGSGGHYVAKVGGSDPADPRPPAEAALFAPTAAAAMSPRLLSCVGAFYDSARCRWVLLYPYLPAGDLAAAAYSTATAGDTLPTPPSAALAVWSDIAHALRGLHAAGIVHGDVKPANVLLDADGRAVLADYGACSALRQLASPAPGRFVGSRAYASPQALDGAPQDPADDVWSAGVLLYQLVTGDLPVAPEPSPAATAAAIRAASDIPNHPALTALVDQGDPDAAAVQAVLAASLVVDPAERASLPLLLASPPLLSPRSTPSPQPPPTPSSSSQPPPQLPPQPSPTPSSSTQPPQRTQHPHHQRRSQRRIKVAGRQTSSLPKSKLAALPRIPRDS